MTDAIILYGPPASGKDTITSHLTDLDTRYAHFERLKVGSGRTRGYRLITADELTNRVNSGDILYTNTRYDSTYAVDRSELVAMMEREKVPVLHIGQTSGIRAVVEGCPANWLVVGLWCSRSGVTRRLAERQDERIAERLAAWDATAADMTSADPALFGLVVNTEVIPAHTAAGLIDACGRGS